MRLSVNNFRKVEKAEIDINTITLVAGLNEAGKTSIAQAAIANLNGNANILGVAKKDAKKLIRDGSKSALVSLKSDDGVSSIKWPSMDIEAKGQAPWSSDYACGVTKFTTLRKDEAAKVISDVLDAMPTKEDFLDAAIPIGGEVLAEKIWSIIDSQGWDAAHSLITENARDLKAEWKMITGDQWGVKKAEGWYPDGFSFELEGSNEDDLRAAIDVAQAAHEENIAQNAVTGERIARLKEKAAEYDNLKKQNDGLKEEINKAKEARLSAEEAYSNTSSAPDEPMSCPHCNKPVVIMSGELHKSDDTISEEERTEMNSKRQKANADLQDARAIVNELETELAGVVNKGKEAVRAQKELNELKEDGALNEAANESDDESVDSFRADLELAQLNLKLFTSWSSATAIHERIKSALDMGSEVGPDGLRQRKAGEAVDKFNAEHLLPLCEAFGISPINLDLDMNVTYRSHLYKFLSESAKFRVDCIIQVALAKLDGSSMVVIDGADIICGNKGRVGLVMMLKAAAIPSLITMSLTKQDSAPDLSALGGNVYWIENSISKELGK